MIPNHQHIRDAVRLVANRYGVQPGEVVGPTKRRLASAARDELCGWLASHGMGKTDIVSAVRDACDGDQWPAYTVAWSVVANAYRRWQDRPESDRERLVEMIDRATNAPMI